MKNNKRKCEICNREFGNLGAHIKSHGYSMKQYYDEYLSSPNDGKCLYCNTDTNFKNLARGYDSFCSKSCSSKYTWENSEGYREMMTETARATMSKNNNSWWNDPEYSEWRAEMAVLSSEKMTKMNNENWKDEDYRNEVIERARKFMNDKAYKSNLDRHAFLRYEKEYTKGTFYIMKSRRYDCLKIGVTVSSNEDPYRNFYNKMNKYTGGSYRLYLGSIKEVADVEYLIKTTLESLPGTTEWYANDDYDKILSLVPKELKLVEVKLE